MRGIASEAGFVEVLDGISIKTLCHGEETLMAEFRLRSGSLLTEHAHPYEQTGYLLRGRMRLFIGGEGREIGPGDSWCIAKDVPHRAEILADSAAIEVFSPPRADYLKYLRPEDALPTPKRA
jgi:quercetin dioxygenase-like cupin family protein